MLICPDNKIQLSKESCVIHLTPSSGLLPILYVSAQISLTFSQHTYSSPIIKLEYISNLKYEQIYYLAATERIE